MKISQINFKNVMGATAAAAMLFMGATTFTSCGKKGCTDAEATNYDADATEDDASCAFLRDQYLGTYNMTDNCTSVTSGPFTYVMTIEEGSGSKLKINLVRLSDYTSLSCEATVTTSGFTITNYTYTSGGSTFVFNGAGTLNGSSLTIGYTILIDGTTTDTCSGSGIKQ